MSALRLLTYNIRYGGVGREPHLIATINACAPDVVLLQEATLPAVVERLSAETGMAQWGTFHRQSLGFLSRTPVEHVEWHRPRFSRHAFLELVPRGAPLRFFGVHLAAVHAAWTERRRVFEVRALLKSVQRHQAGPHVLAGDFNTIAPGEILDLKRLPRRLRPFVWLSGGRIRWRTVQQVLDAGYVDAYRLRHPDDPGFTFPSHDPHIRLDYVFVPGAMAVRVTRCEIGQTGSARLASDHLPLVVEITI